MEEKKLTAAGLTALYNSWMDSIGPKRDNNDQRFGQTVWQEYSEQLRTARDLITSTDKYLDGFQTESPEIAYNQILKLIA